MLHEKRCLQGCKRFIPSTKNAPSGGCNYNGILMVMRADHREWISIVGCASFDNGEIVTEYPIQKNEEGVINKYVPFGFQGMEKKSENIAWGIYGPARILVVRKE